MGGLILGIFNIGIYVVLLLLVGAIILMFANWLGFPISELVQRLYLMFVALIALYMLVALLFGLPSFRAPVMHTQPTPPSIVAPSSY